MVKGVNGWELSKQLDNCEVVVRDFAGAKISWMNHHSIPSLEEGADHFVLHVGTNDLISTKTPEEIAEGIMNLAASLKSAKHDVSISNIIVRRDRFKAKSEHVNNCLHDMCEKNNMFYINHSKIIKQQHINSGRLHLNAKGKAVLGKTFVNHISDIFN